jgi:hypothetical protein
MRKYTLMTLAVLSLGLLAVAAVNVTGTWDYTMVTQRGEQKSTLVFAQDGEKLAVTMTSMGRDGNPVETKGEGTLKGSEIEFKITRTTQRGDMTMVYKGTIVDDNNMKGTMTGGMAREGAPTPEWTAVRKPK